jgi:hypothetical protein
VVSRGVAPARERERDDRHGSGGAGPEPS